MMDGVDLVKSVFQKAIDLEEDYPLTEESRFEEVPGWDSIGHMRIVLEIEGLTGTPMELEEIVGLDTVAKIRDLIARHMS